MTARQQAEEALRRAREDDAPTATCSALLLQAADHLTTGRPQQHMYEAVVSYLAGQLAHERFRDGDSALVDEARREFLAHAPIVRAGETRDEYAIRLRKTARA